MPYSIDDPQLANLLESGCNNGVRSTLSILLTSPTATAGEIINAPSAYRRSATHTNIIAVSTATSAPAFAASVAVTFIDRRGVARFDSGPINIF